MLEEGDLEKVYKNWNILKVSICKGGDTAQCATCNVVTYTENKKKTLFYQLVRWKFKNNAWERL